MSAAARQSASSRQWTCGGQTRWPVLLLARHVMQHRATEHQTSHCEHESRRLKIGTEVVRNAKSSQHIRHGNAYGPMMLSQVSLLLERAMKHRAVGATALNEQSSRSHMVFMLSIAGRHAASGQTVSGEGERSLDAASQVKIISLEARTTPQCQQVCSSCRHALTVPGAAEAGCSPVCVPPHHSAAQPDQSKFLAVQAR